MASIQLRRLLKPLEQFQALPAAQRDRIAISVRLTDRDGNRLTPPPHCWIETSQGRLPIGVAANGSVTVPRAADPDATMHIDRPKGSMSTRLVMTTVPPADISHALGYLRAANSQAQAALDFGARQAGGLFGAWMVPSMNSVSFHFDKCCSETVTVIAAGNMHVFRQARSGDVTVPLDPAWDDTAILRPSSQVDEISPDHG